MALRPRMLLLLGIAAFAASPGLAVQGQQQPGVTVELSTPLVKLGGDVTLRIVVRNADSARLLELPEVPGLTFAQPGRPVESHMSQIFNGRRFEQTTLEWGVRVRPSEAGDYTIPPLTLLVDGVERHAPDEPLALRVIADVEGAERGFLEFVDLPERVYEGQPFDLELRFGWDQEIQLAQADLYLPWWDQMRGVIELESPRRGGANQAEVQVNERARVLVEQLDPTVRDGRVMRTYRLRRRFLATRPDDLELESGTFQFAELLERGIGFRPDRVQRYYAQVPAAHIAVVPVPEEGRPLLWTGAVGHLEAARRVDRRDVDEGDPIALTVSWYGDANLEFFDPPDLSRLDSFASFRVVGTRDEKLDGERRVTYDLVPASAEPTEIPAVPLPVFDPDLERFVTVETDPITIRVRPVEDDVTGYSEAAEPEVVDLRDIHVAPPALDLVEPVRPGALVGWIVGVALGWLGLRFAVRRHGDPDGPAARRRRGARAARPARTSSAGWRSSGRRSTRRRGPGGTRRSSVPGSRASSTR